MRKIDILSIIALLAIIISGILIYSTKSDDIVYDGDGGLLDGLQEEKNDISDVNIVTILRQADEENDHIAISFDEDYFYLVTDSLPDHETGDFPNEGNPNTIEAIDAEYRITRNPEYQDEVTKVKIFGITIGGVSMDPGTAERDEATGWPIEAIQDLFNLGLDFNNAHVQPGGKYHYHGIPESLVEDQEGLEHSELIGFAADGFPIYVRYGYTDTGEGKEMTSSWQLKSGERGTGEPEGSYDGTYTNDFEYIEGSGDLDECNGIFTTTPEYPNGIYAYFLTDEFPYIPRCVHGDPDESFENAVEDGGPPSGGQERNPPTNPPPSRQ